jgi:hypothetical protein
MVEMQTLSANLQKLSHGDGKRNKHLIFSLNEMIFGAHKNGATAPDSAEIEAEDSQSKTEALQRFLGSTPDVTSLQQDTKFEPVDSPERDAPPGMIKLEAFEKPSKNARKNFPAQAGGNSAGC